MSLPPQRTYSFSHSFFALKFFSRIRRILRIKADNRRWQKKPPQDAEEKISEEEMAGNFDDFSDAVLQKSVKMLHFGRWEEKEMAAKNIRKLAEQDLRRRKTMADLGVIPPLVSMVGADMPLRRRLAVTALIQIADGSFTNKALMVEAGILSRLPENISELDEKSKQEFAQLLLSISSLAKSKFSLTSPGKMVSAIISILESSSTDIDTQKSCLGTLLNLSCVVENAGKLIEIGVVDSLIRVSSRREASETALATLGNLVVTLSGRKAVEQHPMVPECLIEILTWEDQPKCQELCCYIVMVLAHQSWMQRQKMREAGIVEVLVQVLLLGSALAQKRAVKIVQWFKDERESTRVVGHSGPQSVRVTSAMYDNEEGKRMMEMIVKQSLHKNMETIIRRANGNGNEDSSNKLKALGVSSSSKSLPY